MKAIVLLTDGFEEVEAVTPIDYLQRAGVEVCTAALNHDRRATGSHNVTVTADKNVAELEGDWDAVLVPGGPGAGDLVKSDAVCALLRKTVVEEKLVAAICASPAVVLAPLGLLKGKRFTCFPGMEGMVKDAFWQEQDVVVDGDIITSRAAGTAAAWALAVIAYLKGTSTANQVAENILFTQRTVLV
ncbi:MAG: DJ-1/PfpI family protein [Treponema sp.]|jgi:4-methyl-5(b-hydroxyethyl)-thiazole monophosphate biosynthesis|nr:DJ-1/PfpI family protein [Treponema sp.]